MNLLGIFFCFTWKAFGRGLHGFSSLPIGPKEDFVILDKRPLEVRSIIILIFLDILSSYLYVLSSAKTMHIVLKHDSRELGKVKQTVHFKGKF